MHFSLKKWVLVSFHSGCSIVKSSHLYLAQLIGDVGIYHFSNSLVTLVNKTSLLPATISNLQPEVWHTWVHVSLVNVHFCEIWSPRLWHEHLPPRHLELAKLLIVTLILLLLVLWLFSGRCYWSHLLKFLWFDALSHFFRNYWKTSIGNFANLKFDRYFQEPLTLLILVYHWDSIGTLLYLLLNQGLSHISNLLYGIFQNFGYQSMYDWCP